MGPLVFEPYPRPMVWGGRRLEELSLAEYRRYHPAFRDDLPTWLDPERAIERRDVPGGPKASHVRAAIAAAKAELGATGG